MLRASRLLINLVNGSCLSGVSIKQPFVTDSAVLGGAALSGARRTERAKIGSRAAAHSVQARAIKY